MSGTNTIRFHQYPSNPNPLKDSDRVVVSQFTASSVYRTGSTPVKAIGEYVKNSILKTGVGSVLSLGGGFIGDGVHQPLALDTNYIQQNFIPNNSVQYSVIGDLKVRYLPLTLSRYNQYSSYNSGDMRCPLCPILTSSGELDIWVQGVNAHKLAMGDWLRSGDPSQAQLIERPFNYSGISGTIIGVVAITNTAAIVKVLNSGSYENWMITLQGGNLNPDSTIGRPVRLGGESDSSGYFTRSMSGYVIGGMRYLTIVNDGVGGNGAGQVIVFQVTGDGVSGVLTQVSTWTVSSYAGLFTNQTQIHYSDLFMGGSSTNCELVDQTGSATVSTVNSHNVTSTLAIYQNPFNDSDVYLTIRRERLIGINGQSARYSADLVFKLSISAGVGSAIAVNRYISQTPTVNAVNGGVQWANVRQTFQGPNRADNENESLTILADGSVVVIGDRFDRLSGGAQVIYSPLQPNGAFTGGDIHALVSGANPPVSFDITPGYNTTSSTFEIAVSSPIPVTINGVSGVLSSQVADLSGLLSSQSSVSLGSTVGASVAYQNITGRKVNLYVQQSGSTIALVATNSVIAESLSNTWVGCVIVPDNANLPPVIIGWAFSRIGTIRQALTPQGGAVPVTGDNPAKPASYWWMQQIKLGPIYPRFYRDAACTQPIISAMTGSTVYIRYHLTKSVYGEQYQCQFNGVSFGTQTWTGNDLVFQGVVNTNITTAEEQGCAITNVGQNRVVAQSSLNVVNSPIALDMLSSDQSRSVSRVYDGTTISVRIRTVLGVIGGNITVSVNGSVVNTLTYQGGTLYTSLTLSQIGQNTITVSNSNGAATGVITVVPYAGIQPTTVNGTVDSNAQTINVAGQNNTFIITNLAKALQYLGRYYLLHVDNSNTGTSVSINGNVILTGSSSADYGANQKDISSLLVEGTNTINAQYGHVKLQGPFLQSVS